MSELELVFYNGSGLLEGPVWDNENNLIYFVAIRHNKIYSLNVDTKELNQYDTLGAVGAAVLDDKGNIIEAEKDGVYSINIKTREKTLLVTAPYGEETRFNDGKIDYQGRFFIGTMGDFKRFPGEEKLYRLEGERLVPVVENLTLSNGLGWTKDSKTMFLIDTPTRKVMMYDYDKESGTCSNPKIAVEITDAGNPDGMCVDIDDNIWVAQYGGGVCRKWNPNTKKMIDEIKLPCRNVTSCCIGGKNNEYLYITTAKEPDKFEMLSGGLFRVKIR